LLAVARALVRRAAMPNVRSLLSSWQRRPCNGLHCAVMRHAERADAASSWSQDPWALSTDAAQWPHDPPLSDSGRIDAQQVARGELLGLEDGDDSAEDVWVVVSSPYFRCVQTAVQVCLEIGPKAVLLLDNELGEVYGPEIMGDDEPTCVLRPAEETKLYVQSHHVRYRSRSVGKWPAWPEYILQMRTRVLCCFLRYLRRSSLARKNFVLITHADGVAAAIAAMPAIQGRAIEKVDYSGLFVASTTMACLSNSGDASPRDDTSPKDAGSGYQSRPSNCWGETEAIANTETEPCSPKSPPCSPFTLLDAVGSWEVRWSRIQLGPRRRGGLLARLRNLAHRTGFSEAHISRLLRFLPEETLEDTSQSDASPVADTPGKHCMAAGSDDAISWSTLLFGVSDSDCPSSPWGSLWRGSEGNSSSSSKRASLASNEVDLTFGQNSLVRLGSKIDNSKVGQNRFSLPMPSSADPDSNAEPPSTGDSISSPYAKVPEVLTPTWESGSTLLQRRGLGSLLLQKANRKNKFATNDTHSVRACEESANRKNKFASSPP